MFIPLKDVKISGVLAGGRETQRTCLLLLSWTEHKPGPPTESQEPQRNNTKQRQEESQQHNDNPQAGLSLGETLLSPQPSCEEESSDCIS